jgi:hypothetical protein
MRQGKHVARSAGIAPVVERTLAIAIGADGVEAHGAGGMGQHQRHIEPFGHPSRAQILAEGIIAQRRQEAGAPSAACQMQRGIERVAALAKATPGPCVGKFDHGFTHADHIEQVPPWFSDAAGQ